MSLSVAVAGTNYSLKYGSLKIQQSLNRRSLCDFTLEDVTGAVRLTHGMPVTVTDSVNGLLFAGFVDQPDEHNLYPNAQNELVVSCMDMHYLADKRRPSVDYTNMAAGDIVTDMLSRYLSAEGVTAGYAYARTTTESDWQSALASATDTFTRANQSGLGTSSDGETYTLTGASATTSIASNEGVIAATGGADTHAQLGSHTAADGILLCRVAINNANDIVGIEARFSSASGSTCYKWLYDGPGAHFLLNKSVSGTNTTLATLAQSQATASFFWLKLQFVGTNLAAKTWLDGTPEPGAWQVTASDSSVSAAGGFALLGNSSSGAGIQYDHFSAMPLSGVIGTGNVGDGDLELAPAGIEVTHTDTSTSDFAAGTLTSMDAQNNQLNLHAYNVIKLVATNAVGSGNDYCYQSIYNVTGKTIANGDKLTYDVWVSSSSPLIMAGVDILCTSGQSLRDSGAVDQFNISAHPNADLNGFANDQWYSRTIDLSILTGQTIAYVSVVFEGDTAGIYQAYFRNIIQRNSGGTAKNTFYDSTAAPYVPSSVSISPNVTAGNAGYAAISCTSVTAYDQSGTRVSPAISLTAAQIVNSSLVTWSSLIPANATTPGTSAINTPQIPTGTTLTIATSIDEQGTWQACTYKAGVPDLLPGAQTSGRNVYTRVSMGITAQTPEVSPVLTDVTVSVTSSYTQASSAQTISTIKTNSDFNTGTYTHTQFGTDGGLTSYLTLAGITDSFLYPTGGGLPSYLTGFFSTPYGATVDRKRLALTLNGTGDVRARFDTAPNSYQDFTASVALTIPSTGDIEMGLVYRTTGWQNNNDTYAYSAMITSAQARLRRGTNSNVGAGAWTAIASANFPAALTVGNTYTMTIVVSGSTHQIFIDGVLYITATDATYGAAGEVAYRAYNNSGGPLTYYFTNYGIVPALSGTWVSAALSPASYTVGGSMIQYDADIPVGCTVLCETTVDGGSTWQTALSGQPIPNLAVGSTTPAHIQTRFTLTAASANQIVTVHGYTLWVVSLFAASGNRVSPALSLANVGRAGASNLYWNAANDLSTLYSDTFGNRTTAVGETQAALGTASDGHAWVLQGDTHADLSVGVTPGEGNVFYDGAGGGSGSFVATLGGNTQADTDITTRLSFLANTGSPVFALYLRYANANNYYTAIVDSAGNLTIKKNVAGVLSTITSAVLAGVTLGDYVHLRFHIEGTCVLAKGWLDGATEPLAWTIITSDSSLSSAGYSGIGATVAGLTAGAGINFDSLVISHVNLAVDISPDGTTWTDVSGYNGAAIPTIYTQPDPYLDFFAADSHTNYTQSNLTGGGAATWTWDTANHRLTAVQTTSTGGVLEYPTVSRADGYVEGDFNTSDSGGLLARMVDASHAYLLSICDASAASTPNTARLYAQNPGGSSTPLTLYGAKVASGTLATAGTFDTGTGGADVVALTKIGTSTGYGELCALGTSVAWAAAGSLPAPSGNGFLFDVTTLEGQTLLAGSYTISLILNTSVGTATADIYIRAYKRASGGALTLIGSTSLAGQNFTTAQATYSWTPSLSSMAFATGDKLYVDAPMNITVNGTGSSSANMKLHLSSSSSGVANDLQIVTAGYQPTVGSGLTLLSSAAISFTRGDYHHFRLDVQGTAITAQMDGVQILSATDSSVAGAGVYGLLAGLGNGHILDAYSLRVQAYGDNVTSQSLYTRLRLSSSNPQVTPQVEDLTLSVHSPAIGNGALVTSTNYAFVKSIAQSFDDLATQSTSPNPYVWYIGNTAVDLKQLNFRQNRTAAAPFYVWPNKSLLWTRSPIVVSRPDMLYRNRQTVDGGFDTTTVIPETRLGDGFTQSWVMTYPLAGVPTITQTDPTVNLANQPASVGIQGVDTGKDFYYTPGSNVISQDLSATPPSATDVLNFSYVGQIPVRVTLDNTGVENAAALPYPTVSLPGTITQSQMAAIDGTSGIVEDYVAIPGLNKADATAQCRALLQQYGALGRTIVFATKKTGLAPGQLVPITLSQHGIVNSPFLITDVTITNDISVAGADPDLVGNLVYYFLVSATEGPILGNWTTFYGKLLAALA